MNKFTKKRGITLIEVVVYTALLAFLSVLVIRASLSMYDTYVYVTVLSDINNSATLASERLTREIRDAETVDIVSSTLDSSPGLLVVNSPSGEATISKSFYINEQDQLVIEEEGGNPIALTEDQLEVTNLVFRHIVTNHSEAIKVEMTLQNTVKGEVIERNYFNTILLRASY